jgi:Mlc titration factor MtfA (ptsG expression regulator)
MDETPRRDAETAPAPTGERARSRIAFFTACAAGAVVFTIAWGTGHADWRWGLGALLLAWVLHRWMTRRDRRRTRIRRQPFPPEWDKILHGKVAFFNALGRADKSRFREELKIFLAEKQITGIRTEVDETTRVLAAASAIIPIFGFPEWEWDQISEILIYPTRFDESFRIEDGEDRPVLGMVGSGVMNRMMILSKPDLHQGFRNARDRRNVGIHEFAHLVDKSDGAVDGVPEVGLDRRTVGPWLELMRRKMAEIESGRSDINPYALTNESEFFAVVTEYFFERPRTMQRRHPELYRTLARVFQQDMISRVRNMIVPTGGKLGRNSRCPCGSGRKYKKCCLNKS